MKKRSRCSLTTQADVEGAWLEEALAGIGALKRAWGKPSGMRVLVQKVEILFKTGSCLTLRAPASTRNWSCLAADLRDEVCRRDWFDVVKTPNDGK